MIKHMLCVAVAIQIVMDLYVIFRALAQMYGEIPIITAVLQAIGRKHFEFVPKSMILLLVCVQKKS